MNAVSPWAILVFGIAFGACLPVLFREAHRQWSRRWRKPTLLHLDPAPGLGDAASARRILERNPAYGQPQAMADGPSGDAP